MDYAETHEEHVIFLNDLETNKFFDVYDPNDSQIPSYLLRNGHRFIKEDIYAWLEENIGLAGVQWRSSGNRYNRHFSFVKKESAVLFKLTFG